MEVATVKSDVEMSWKKVKLEEVCKIVGGTTPSTSKAEFWNGDIIWLSPVDLPEVGSISIINDSLRKITSEAIKSCSLEILPTNSIVFSTRASIGKIGIVEQPLCTNQGFTNLIPSEKIYHKYLAYALKYNIQNISRLGNSTTFNEVSRTAFKNFQIPLPPLSTQKRIAEILDAADALRRKDQELLKKYDELAQSIFIDMFGDPVKNEKGWEVKKLHEVCKQIFGGGTPSKSIPKYYQGSIPWVTPKDMKSDVIHDSIDHINLEAVKNSSTKLVPEGSVLMVIRSGILKHTLPVAINAKEVSMNQDMKAFIPNTELTNSVFIKYFFKSVSGFLLSKVRAVTADNIEFEQIRNMRFICPPIALQGDFSLRVSNVHEQFEDHLKSRLNSDLLFNTLLQKSFKGELVA